MTLRLLPFLLLICLSRCADVDPGPPPVDTDRLSRTLADLQLAEALVSEVPVILRDSMQALYYESVLEEYGYTRESFDSVMWIIRSEPVWIDSIYTRAGIIVSKAMIEQ